MDLFRFVTWWWRKLDAPERTLTVILTWFLLTFPSMYFFGITALLVSFGVIFAVLTSVLLYLMFGAVKNQWHKFKDEKEVEAQRIVDKLAGVNRSKTSVEEMLEQLRASR